MNLRQWRPEARGPCTECQKLAYASDVSAHETAQRSRHDRPQCPDQVGAALPKLRKTLPQQDWDALLAVRAELPIWLVELLNEQATQELHG
jgi:hypothetical protein